MGRKIKKCPHCKSKRGFRYDYGITGNGSEVRDFNGNVIDSHRETFDDIDYYNISCLNCGVNLKYDKLNL